MRDPLRTALMTRALTLVLLLVGALSPSVAAGQTLQKIADAEAPASDPADEVPQRTADRFDHVPQPAPYPTADFPLRASREAIGVTEPASDDGAEVGEAASDATADVPQPASEAVGHFEDWVVASGDNGGLPFMIIDKQKAEVLIFAPDGELRGAAPALLGLARGDDSVPGIGDRKLSSIRPKDRTTPAGRFIAAFGPAIGQGDVLWVDYNDAVSLHPVITANRKERRVERLRTPTPEDNRITFGCINVPYAFYEKVVRPAFTGANAVVYILPDTKPLEEVFPAFRSQQHAESVAAHATVAAQGSTQNAPD